MTVLASKKNTSEQPAMLQGILLDRGNRRQSAKTPDAMPIKEHLIWGGGGRCAASFFECSRPATGAGRDGACVIKICSRDHRFACFPLPRPPSPAFGPFRRSMPSRPRSRFQEPSPKKSLSPKESRAKSSSDARPPAAPSIIRPWHGHISAPAPATPERSSSAAMVPPRKATTNKQTKAGRAGSPQPPYPRDLKPSAHRRVQPDSSPNISGV